MRILLTKQEFASTVKVSVRTVENWMKHGIIAYIKILGVVRIPEEEITLTLNRYQVNRRTMPADNPVQQG